MTRTGGPDLGWLLARPIAHRGLHDGANGVIENSLPAFSRAVEAGFAIECDLQITADGEALVFHDDTLDRLTGLTGPVGARNSEELCGIAFSDGAGFLPTLAQLLDLVDGRVPVVLELKSQWNDDARLGARVANLLQSYSGKAAVMSFDPAPISWFAENAEPIPRGIVADGATHEDYAQMPEPMRLALREFSHRRKTQPHFVSLWHEWLSSPSACRLRDEKLPIISWTIRDPQQAADALEWSDQITFEGYDPDTP